MAGSVDDVIFPVQRFMGDAARALIAHDQGNVDFAKKYARTALRVAGIQESGFRYHRKVGLVGPENRPVILRLKAITTGYPVWFHWVMARVG